MVPVSWRSLADCLNPQPKAQEVMHRLLDWIDRVDMASHAGIQRPPFCTPAGEPIFPEDDDDMWWLTELQRRHQDAAKRADEDGPASSEEAQDEEQAEGPPDDAELTDDEDASSSQSHEGVAEPSEVAKDAPPPPTFHAEVHWPRDGTESSK